MNRVVEPVGPDESGVDALLGAFFRSEVPSPWPDFQPPRHTLPFRPAAKPRKRRGFLAFSRLALVASVALLLLAAWLMPRGPLSSPDGLKFNLGVGKASLPDGKEKLPELEKSLLPQLPDLKDVLPPAEGDDKAPGKVKSSLQLEQKDGKTGIKITVEELPPNK